MDQRSLAVCPVRHDIAQPLAVACHARFRMLPEREENLRHSEIRTRAGALPRFMTQMDTSTKVLRFCFIRVVERGTNFFPSRLDRIQAL